MGYVQRIRNYKISEPPFYWKQRMKELCGELNIVQPVQLLESAIVKIPVVVGLLKPVILNAAWVFAQLIGGGNRGSAAA